MKGRREKFAGVPDCRLKKSGGKSQSNFPLSDWRRTGEKAARAFLCGRRRSPTLSAYPRLRAQGIFAFSKKPRRFSNFKQKQLRRPELFFYICNVSISQFLLFLRLSFSAFQPYVPFCRSRPFRRPRRRIFCFFPKRTALFLLSCAPCFPAAAGYAILSKILM